MSKLQTVYAISSQGYFNTSRPSNHPSIIRANQRNIHLGYAKCNQIYKGQSSFKNPKDEETYKASRSLPTKSYMTRSQITDASTNNLDQSSRNGYLLTPNVRQIKRTKTLISRSVHFGSSIQRIQRSSQSGSSQQKNDKPIYDFQQTMKIKIPLDISQFDSFKSQALNRQVSTPHFNKSFQNRNEAAINLHLNSEKKPEHKLIKNLNQAARLENSYHSNTSSSGEKAIIQNSLSNNINNSYNEQIHKKLKMFKGQNKLIQFNNGNIQTKYNNPVSIKFNKVIQDKYIQPTITSQYYKKDDKKLIKQPIKQNPYSDRVQNKFQIYKPTLISKIQNNIGLKKVELNRNLDVKQAQQIKQKQLTYSISQTINKNQNNYKISQSRYYEAQYQNNLRKQPNLQPTNNNQNIRIDRNIINSRIIQQNPKNLYFSSNFIQQNKNNSPHRSYQPSEQNKQTKMSESRIKISLPFTDRHTQQKDSRNVINLIPSSYYTQSKRTIEAKKKQSQPKPLAENSLSVQKGKYYSVKGNQNQTQSIQIQVPNTSINIKKTIKFSNIVKSDQKINNSNLSQLDRLRQQLAKKQKELKQYKNSLQISQKKNKSLQIQVKKLQTNNQLSSQNKYSLANYPTYSNSTSLKYSNQKEVGASAFLYLTFFMVLLAKDMTGK